MPVGEMLRRMSSQELEEWRILFEKEGRGEFRDDLRIATLALPIVALMEAYLLKHPRSRKLSDWIHDWNYDPTKAKQTSNQMKAIFQAIASIGKAQPPPICKGVKRAKR